VRLLLLLAVAVAGFGYAERIEIDTGGDDDSRLEIRNVVLPSGAQVQLYVIQGEQVRVTIGERQLVGQHLEVDLTNRLVRVVGTGTFVTPQQTVHGSDLVIDLDSESLSGQDVLIVTESIDVLGASAVRMPGQIDVMSGAFSPCSRCGQEVEDYGFRAGRIELYPGDRLVAFDATVLVRGRALLVLPVLVVPLARPDRQPRLSLSQGSATERAEVALDWPYVAGANAYGTFSVRYYADVVPVAGGLRPLGGDVVTDYLGAGVEHLFYTERGQGAFGLSYRPGFLDLAGGERERSRFQVRLAYETLDEAPTAATETGAGLPSVDLELVRDDETRDRLLEYRIELAGVEAGVRATVSSQGFADADPLDAVTSPSFDDRSTPRRTPLRLVLEPEAERFTVGPLLLQRLAVDIGAFEDASNPTNRSAAAREFSDAGRLLERHSLQLTTTPLWSGMELSGHSNFVGHYYTTGERQIDWDSRLSANQRLGRVGAFGVVFTRDVNEGETPFRFDQIPLRVRTDLRGTLRLEPLPWLTFEAENGYVFRDSRRPELEGFQPLQTRLRLFENLDWLSAEVENSYDIEAGDPGRLDFEVELSSPESSPRAELRIEHVHDLAVLPDRLTGEPTDETSTGYSVVYGVTGLRLDASGGYRYRPAVPTDPAEPIEYWLPFEAGLTFGTLEQQDSLPGLRVAYVRDLNRRRVAALSYDAAARLGPVELSARQRFDLPEGGTSSSSLRVTYPGIAAVEAIGFELVRPAWLGLPEGDPRTARYSVTLRDAPLVGRETWQVRYQTRFDPNLATPDGDGGFRDTSVETRLVLEDERFGASRLSVDLFTDLQLRDDRLEVSYVRRASLQLAADLGGRVGLQGALAYRGTLDSTTNELSRAELRIDEVAVTVRASEQLYVGALFDDVWDFTGNTFSEPAFDIRPELFVVWDRCCWALHAGWNSASGELRFSLTAPGASEGLTQIIDSPLVLPGREGVAAP
jgi:hypothetical protein